MSASSVLPSNWERQSFAWDFRSNVKRPRGLGTTDVVREALTGRIVGRDVPEFDVTNPRVNVTWRVRLYYGEPFAQGIQRSSLVLALKCLGPTQESILGGSPDDPLAPQFQAQAVLANIPTFNYLMTKLALQRGLAESPLAPDRVPTVDWVFATWALGGVVHTSQFNLDGEAGELIKVVDLEGRVEVSNMWQYAGDEDVPSVPLGGDAYLHLIIKEVPLEAESQFVPVTRLPPRYLGNVDVNRRVVKSVVRAVPVWTHDGVVPRAKLRYESYEEDGAVKRSYGFAMYVGRVTKNPRSSAERFGLHPGQAMAAALDADQLERGQTMTVDINIARIF